MFFMFDRCLLTIVYRNMWKRSNFVLLLGEIFFDFDWMLTWVCYAAEKLQSFAYSFKFFSGFFLFLGNAVIVFLYYSLCLFMCNACWFLIPLFDWLFLFIYAVFFLLGVNTCLGIVWLKSFNLCCFIAMHVYYEFDCLLYGCVPSFCCICFIYLVFFFFLYNTD